MLYFNRCTYQYTYTGVNDENCNRYCRGHPRRVGNSGVGIFMMLPAGYTITAEWRGRPVKDFVLRYAGREIETFTRRIEAERYAALNYAQCQPQKK